MAAYAFRNIKTGALVSNLQIPIDAIYDDVLGGYITQNDLPVIEDLYVSPVDTILEITLTIANKPIILFGQALTVPIGTKYKLPVLNTLTIQLDDIYRPTLKALSLSVDQVIRPTLQTLSLSVDSAPRPTLQTLTLGSAPTLQTLTLSPAPTLQPLTLSTT